MRPIPVTPQTAAISRRVIWFEEPEEALSDPVRFMAYALTYARHEDMRVIRQYVSDEEIRQALDSAPPGIIDARSWAYWNLKVGRFPPPPMRTRSFDNRSTVPSAPGMSLEARRRAAVETGRTVRGQEPATDMEEARRRAVRDWREKYHPEKKQ